MVTKNLATITSGEGELAENLSKQIQGLRIQNLRKIKNHEEIERMCMKVITAVDALLLVHIDEVKLASRKIPKRKNIPAIKYTDDDHWNYAAKIREGLYVQRWEKESPHGWIYYDSNDSILGIIYETEDMDHSYSAFLKREVADNPIGARLLLKEMKDRLHKVIHHK